MYPGKIKATNGLRLCNSKFGGETEENNLDRRCIMEDAQIGGISLRQDRLV